MKRTAPLRIIAAIAMAVALPASLNAGGRAISTGGGAKPAKAPDAGYIIVQLSDAPAASYEGTVAGLTRTKPSTGKFDAKSDATKAYHAYLDSVHVNYRAWLAVNAPKAQVLRTFKTTFNGLAIKLSGENAAKVAGGPGATAYSSRTFFYPAMTESVKIIGAPAVWAGARPDAGKGIVVAVLDTGIADGHPFFACKGSGGIPRIKHFGPYFTGDPAETNGVPLINRDHGTHVAGTVGGCVSSLNAIDPGGPVKGTISGVAPGVTLYDFNVFPGNVEGVSNDDLIAAIEDAVAEGVDVINMSLGGFFFRNDPLQVATDAAVDAGVVVVAAAGNDGPGEATIHSPGAAIKAIAAGASSNPHFLGVPMKVGSYSFGGVIGDFDNFGDVTAGFTTTTPADGCTAISEDLTGLVAVIDRGACTFSTKILAAEANGAVGTLIANNRAGDPTGMALDDTLPFPGIPALMISQVDGAAIKPSGVVTIEGTTQTEIKTSSIDIKGDFSGEGPVPYSFRVKPDVMAPGVNVYSSIFTFDDQGHRQYSFEFFNGTSMATPHTAGSAAVLLQKHPTWSPADVRSALMHTASRTVTDYLTGTTDPGVLIRGAGRISLPDANSTPVTIDTAHFGFGLWKGNRSVVSTLSVRVKNVSTTPKTATLSVTGPAIVSASPSSLALAPGQTKTLSVTLDAGKKDTTPSGDYAGDVVLSVGSRQLKVPWWTRIDREARP